MLASRHIGCALYPIAPVPALNVYEERYLLPHEAAHCLEVWACPRDFMCASPQFSSLFRQIRLASSLAINTAPWSCSALHPRGRRDDVREIMNVYTDMTDMTDMQAHRIECHRARPCVPMRSTGSRRHDAYATRNTCSRRARGGIVIAPRRCFQCQKARRNTRRDRRRSLLGTSSR